MIDLLPSGDWEVPLQPIELGIVERDIRRLASYPDPFAENAGIDLAAFLREPSTFSAAMLARSLQTLASAMRRSARGLEGIGIDLEIRSMDALAEAQIARQREEA